ncbi:MAG: DNA polymerase III subunit gamma/tau [Pelatocladus maniniholoensis HA4357-MV3]|jgi:DNA polymerase-3 subunit gamma/tau|uniref:DNA polymerase III subunit gamma/tau n=1 Tax=Pelatocladus maniniholoensis HA4357-MV3 TaxID=1117104 RepID=A0A9E3H9I6_9NOST|nr:DNA polymerase III subunit gamma/tau [Pelatocladus maniniholoensis HA4357-MV3]
MKYQPLHLKYRPQSFAQLVGQQAIATTLTNAITSGRIAPAYLFTGPRGTGKTSSARILAKSLNCQHSDSPTPEPCGKCDSCTAITGGSSLDVVEIDAASNSGVENIKQIIDRTYVAPVNSRYKVYCIDECHSLSNQAFQALLKTLEEPPANVVFVLCTTEVHKVPATIASRCQRFDFKRIAVEDMVKHLNHIVSDEIIDITPEALRLVAQMSSGCLRDAECLLDQLSLLDTTITPNWVWELAGTVPEYELLTLVERITDNDSDAVITIIRNLLEWGKEPLVILQNLTSFYRDMLIAKTSPNNKDMVTLTEDTWKELCQTAKNSDTTTILQAQQHLRQSEVQIKLSTQPQLWLEVAILGLLSSASTISTRFIPISDSPPWINWKTPTDAIAWAQQQLPNMNMESLQQKWDSLVPVNGKKAPVWVETVQQLIASR